MKLLSVQFRVKATHRNLLHKGLPRRVSGQIPKHDFAPTMKAWTVALAV